MSKYNGKIHALKKLHGKIWIDIREQFDLVARTRAAGAPISPAGGPARR